MLQAALQTIAQKLTALAPRIVTHSLNKGAIPQDFEHLEAVIQKRLPADFRELYATYNGTNDEDNWGNFFYGMTFSSIDDIIADHAFCVNQSKNIPPIPLKTFDSRIDGSDLYNLNWLSIGSDSSRCRLLVDLAPADTGNYGQVIFVDGTYNVGIHVAASVTELVTHFAADLDRNLYSLEPDALEDGHHFLDPHLSIDLLNWYGADKWKHLAEG